MKFAGITPWQHQIDLNYIRQSAWVVSMYVIQRRFGIFAMGRVLNVII